MVIFIIFYYVGEKSDSLDWTVVDRQRIGRNFSSWWWVRWSACRCEGI